MKRTTVFRAVILALAASGCQAVIGLSDYSQGGNSTTGTGSGLQPPPLASSSGGTCAGWVQTNNCVANGQVEPQNSQPCGVQIQSGASGYCVCSTGAIGADCTHTPDTCSDVCAMGTWPSGQNGGWSGSFDAGISFDAGTGDGGRCGPNECLGTDNQCYGPCNAGYCTLDNSSGNCSSASPGNVYCCEQSQPSGGGCDQTCQDDNVGFAIDDSLIFLYNQNLAGKTAGNQNVTANCPGGGTVTITGYDSVSQVSGGSIVNVMFSFDMRSCTMQASTYSLTFTGAVTQQGTFPASNTPGSNALTDRSSTLAISGTLLDVNVSINESCDVSLTNSWNHVMGATGWLNGTLCGRTVSQ